MIYFSMKTCAFYDDEIYTLERMPDDAVFITVGQHQAMLEHLNSGGRIEFGGDDSVFIQPAPDAYYFWNETKKAWETNEELQEKKQADAEALKQAEISVLLMQAARKVSEYQDLVDFAETPAESEAGEVGLLAWRQYRAALMKYQKGLILSLPTAPE